MLERDAREAELRALADRLGIPIHRIELFDHALTHASLVGESDQSLRDYESLEFLGDAVLGLAAAHHLYETLPDRTPGEYSPSSRPVCPPLRFRLSARRGSGICRICSSSGVIGAATADSEARMLRMPVGKVFIRNLWMTESLGWRRGFRNAKRALTT